MTSKREKKYCSVFGCLNNDFANPDLSFFIIPTEPEIRLQWLRVIDRGDLSNKPNHNERICEVHFKSEDISMNSQRKRLQKNCLPCLRLPKSKENKGTQTEETSVKISTQIDLPSCSCSCKTEISTSSNIEVQTAASLSGDAVKSKWKTLRDGYTKYKKQVRELSGSRKKQHQYLWSSQLQFLDDYNLPKNDTQDGEISQDYMLPQINLPSPTNMPSPSQGTYDDRKRTHDGDVDEVMNYLSSKKQKDYDGVDHLFLSYADTFKKFSPRTQALLKLEMAKLFAGAELKSLKNGEDIEYDVNETDISLVVKKEDPL